MSAALFGGPAVATPAASWVAVARSELGRLHVHPLATIAGYSRAQFGPAWEDIDHSGCDTRDQILRRDLVHVTLRSDGCTVETGVLHDPYTGRTIDFRSGVKTSALVQIDHVVALGDAWQTGAAHWTAVRRLDYANDPLVLLAVDGRQNEIKGDEDTAAWQPPDRVYDCAYVARQISIKTAYGLWVTAAEKAAMQHTFTHCADATPPQTVSSSTSSPSAVSTVTPGAYCSHREAIAPSRSGRRYRCEASTTDPRLRWRHV